MSVDWGDWQAFDGSPGKPLAEVDRATANRYFDDLMLSVPERVEKLEALLRGNGVTPGFEDPGLQSLNDWYRANVEADPDTVHRLVEADPDAVHRLAPRWYAVGLDIGIYLGEAIIARTPGTGWHLFTSGKRNVSYQRPVLMGFAVPNSKYNVDPERLVWTEGHRIVSGLETAVDALVQVARECAAIGGNK